MSHDSAPAEFMRSLGTRPSPTRLEFVLGIVPLSYRAALLTHLFRYLPPATRQYGTTGAWQFRTPDPSEP